MRVFKKAILAAWVAIIASVFALVSARADIPTADSQDDYVVGAGDLLRIAVFGYPDMAGDVRVSQTGNITYPMIGSVSVGGLSAHEIENKLSSQLAAGHFIQGAQVTVLITEFQSQRVAVMGEVANPGQYPLQGGRRVLNVLADAGGVVTKNAGDSAVLIRKDGSSVSIDLIRMLAGDIAQNPRVNAGDIVNVPKAPQFFVYGEVNKPGVYRLERDMAVIQGVSAAGGLTRRGSERRLYIRRKSSPSSPVMEFRAVRDDPLKPDDVLVVREGLF